MLPTLHALIQASPFSKFTINMHGQGSYVVARPEQISFPDTGAVVFDDGSRLYTLNPAFIVSIEVAPV